MTMTSAQLLAAITLIDTDAASLTAEQRVQLDTLKQRYEILKANEAIAAGAATAQAVSAATSAVADVTASVATRGLQFALGALSIFRK